MVKVKYVSVDSVKSLKRRVKKRAAVLEYEGILKKLPQGQAGEIDAKKEDEKPMTIKNRIVRIGKSLGMTHLKVKRVGDVVLFWVEDDKTET